MWDRDGLKVNLRWDVLETRRIVLINQNGLAWMSHGPTEGVNVLFGFDADGGAQPVSSKHVDCSSMTGAFGDVVEHRHGVSAGLGMVQHAVNEANF